MSVNFSDDQYSIQLLVRQIESIKDEILSELHSIEGMIPTLRLALEPEAIRFQEERVCRLRERLEVLENLLKEQYEKLSRLDGL